MGNLETTLQPEMIGYVDLVLFIISTRGCCQVTLKWSGPDSSLFRQNVLRYGGELPGLTSCPEGAVAERHSVVLLSWLCRQKE